MKKKYLTEYENPKAWDRVRELCQQIESGQLDDKIPEIMDEIHNLTPPTETQYLWVNCYEESCDMDRELMKSLKKRINQLKLNENMKKNKIRLTESQLHRVIKESVKKVLNEGNTTNIITNCNANMQYVLNNIKNEFDNIYSLLRDGESISDAMKMYSGLNYKFAYEYPYAIGKAYQPLMNAYVKTQSPNNTEYEPEDWHERNEHGDFDSH